MNENGRSCLVPAVLILIALLAIGYWGLRYAGFDLSKLLPRRSHEVEIIDPSKDLEAAERREKSKPKEPEPVAQPVEEPPEPPPPPPKSMAEIRAEAEVAQKALDAEIAAARLASRGREIKTFSGITFGAVMKGSPIRAESYASADGSNGCDTVLLMHGPKLKSPFQKFDNPPFVRVTPKTQRIFQIEFTRAIARTPGWKLNDETTNLVALLARRLKCKPFALDCEKYPLGDHTFVFPLGETTLTVGEYGGERLKFTVETAALRDAIRTESAEVRELERGDWSWARPLTSDKYPNAGHARFKRARIKSGTPRSFCGVVFGSLPPYGVKGGAFYIDYRKAKCKPFLTFDHGKVEVNPVNEGAVAVSLFSNGSDCGWTDADFFARAAAAIEHRFKVKPTAAEGDGPVRNLTYAVGDLKITLGPDPAGGFYLKAVHESLKSSW